MKNEGFLEYDADNWRYFSFLWFWNLKFSQTVQSLGGKDRENVTLNEVIGDVMWLLQTNKLLGVMQLWTGHVKKTQGPVNALKSNYKHFKAKKLCVYACLKTILISRLFFQENQEFIRSQTTTKKTKMDDGAVEKAVEDPPPTASTGVCDYHTFYPLPDEVLEHASRCDKPSQHLHQLSCGKHHHDERGISPISNIFT